MRFFLFILFFITILDAKLTILDVFEYKSKTISELSALAYDGKTLYALSDYGVLHHFDLEIKNNKIKKIDLIKSYQLKNKQKKRLKKKKRDSEGLVYLNHNLYVSFEEVPRVEKHTLDGVKLGKVKIPKILNDIDNYNSKNDALESLTYSKKYGFLTAPESPFQDEKMHTIYSTKGKIFKFRKSGKITELEFINKHSILVLERKYNFFTRKLKITISKISLNRCKSDICKSKKLKVLTDKNCDFLDNYEGLTKIKNNLFLMVSDDNKSYLQKTYFVLFSI